MSVRYTDKSLMPLGSYKGKMLANVPAQHLIWLYEQTWFTKTSALGMYIADNVQVLKQQAQTDKQLKR